jgi:hypothetical protein
MNVTTILNIVSTMITCAAFYVLGWYRGRHKEHKEMMFLIKVQQGTITLLTNYIDTIVETERAKQEKNSG